jgi:hypothetical protein
MAVVQNNKVIEKTVGMVVREWEKNGYDDSDFWCTYWDIDTQSFQSMEWGTTRCAAGPGYGYGCKVDAPADLMAYYAEVCKLENAIYAQTLRAMTPQKGDKILVTGTKKWLGRAGEVKWVGKDQYAWGARYGRSTTLVYGVKIDGYDKLVYIHSWDFKITSLNTNMADAFDAALRTAHETYRSVSAVAAF